MAPGTGTPDYAASSIRIHSSCHRGIRISARLLAAVLSIPLVLAGCTSQPPAPETPASPRPDYSASEPVADDPGAPAVLETARSGGVTPPDPDIRLPVPFGPTEITMLDDGPPPVPEPRSAEEPASDRDTWDRIRDGMDLQYPDKKQVRRS
ncbi:MAG: hypothetical protein OXI15_18700, partial [Chromatiales bacterium]|nr:hypothetical protein [Chromatiales bacterium]